jgi:alanine dehydrogenase
MIVLGAGTVGVNAARIALDMGAGVTLFDVNLERLRFLDATLNGRFVTLASHSHVVAEAVATADVVIGAVLVPGARAPRLVTREMVAGMLPGAVIVDVAVDQGGCIETIHATTHSAPAYVLHGVVHYGVANMPGAVPRTSTMALCNATLPYALRLAGKGVAAFAEDHALARGVNTYRGAVVHAAVAEALDLPHRPLMPARDGAAPHVPAPA